MKNDCYNSKCPDNDSKNHICLFANNCRLRKKENDIEVTIYDEAGKINLKDSKKITKMIKDLRYK